MTTKQRQNDPENAAPEAPAVSGSPDPSTDDGWTTVHAESAAVVIFNEPGDTFIGIYDGEEHIHPDSAADDSDDFDRFRFTGTGAGGFEDGKPYAINESYTLREAMAKVKVGELCRIVYVKEIATKRSLNPLKDFRVDVKR